VSSVKDIESEIHCKKRHQDYFTELAKRELVYYNT